MIDVKRTCKHCNYWNPERTRKEAGKGECRRNSPRTRVNANVGYYRPWVSTFKNDWCGDFSEEVK